MKLPLSWLKEFVLIRLKPGELAKRLTFAGFEVEGITQEKGEVVFDIAVTPNRGDALSIQGLAREVAALQGASLKPQIGSQPAIAGNIRDFVSIDLQEKEGCCRYAMRVVQGVRVGPSPDWLVSRLEACGVRSINNVVDVTNYVLLERGQPLHAFDLEKIQGGRVIVRRARKEESFQTLDGTNRKLSSEDLLIADSERGIALAGIMGGANSEVSEETTTVALESAYFNPAWIRRSSKKFGIITESSYRFERGIDPEGVVSALNQATTLMGQLAGGKATRDWADRYPKKIRQKPISWDPGSVEELMGGSWPVKQVVENLNRLGVRRRGKQWIPPSYRHDLCEGVDLTEEVARLAGYDRIPVTLPSLIQPVSMDHRRRMTQEVRLFLADLGFSETIHLSFLSPEEIAYDPVLPEICVPLANPLGREDSILRPSLLPSLLKNVAYHHQHQRVAVRLFELRHCFQKGNGGVSESERLAVVLSGSPLISHWGEKRLEADYFDIKGLLETILQGKGELAFEPTETPALLPGNGAKIFFRSQEIGIVGEIHPGVARRFQVKKRTSLFEIHWGGILDLLPEERQFRPFSRLPTARRDLAIVVEASLEAGKILRFLSNQERELLREVRLFDVYQGDQIPKGKKGLAFSFLLGREDRTLTEEEINEAWGRIQESVRREFHGDIR